MKKRSSKSATLCRIALLGSVAACSEEGGGATMPPAPPPPLEARETQHVALDSGLVGTLELPERRGPVPVVLIHPGSGPTDRDGNTPLVSGRNDSLKMLAEGLAAAGIASLRVDKRGVAGSAAAGPKTEAELRFEMFVDDAASWLRGLARDARFSRLVMLGHSEGALIGLLAARAVPEVAAAISLAGPGRPAGAALREQLRPQLTPGLYQRAEQIIAALEAGQLVADVPPALAPLFRSSVQPYLIGWFAHDPVRVLAGLAQPAQVVQGTTDVQVPTEDAQRLAAARAGVELVLIEGMNHVLKRVSGNASAQLPSYGDPSLPLAPELLPALAAFVKGR